MADKVIEEVVVKGQRYKIKFDNQIIDGDITTEAGKIVSKSTNIDKDIEPQSDTWGNSRIDIRDNNGNRLAYIQPKQMPTGETDLHIVRDGDNNPNGKVLINGVDIETINANLSDNLGGTSDTFKFATDGDGNYGYVKKVEGADTFFPFSKGAQLVGNYTGNASIDVTSYRPKSADEFYIVPTANKSIGGSFSTWNYGGTIIVYGAFSVGSKVLNGNTLTITAPTLYASGSLPNIDSWSGSAVIPYSVYFIASL